MGYTFCFLEADVLSESQDAIACHVLKSSNAVKFWPHADMRNHLLIDEHGVGRRSNRQGLKHPSQGVGGNMSKGARGRRKAPIGLWRLDRRGRTTARRRNAMYWCRAWPPFVCPARLISSEAKATAGRRGHGSIEAAGRS